MDLLEGLSNSKAHLPVQDVLSIFFQVLLMPQRLCYASSCHMADTFAIHGIASDASLRQTVLTEQRASWILSHCCALGLCAKQVIACMYRRCAVQSRQCISSSRPWHTET